MAEISFLNRALKKVDERPNENGRERRLELRKQQLEEAKKELASVLPIEGEEGKNVIKLRIELLELCLADPTFEERYRCLDMEVLRWRTKSGLPRLVIFSQNNPLFSISAHFSNWEDRNKFNWSLESFPKAIKDNYEDIRQKIKEMCDDNVRTAETKGRNWEWDIELKNRFTGVVPQETREKIAAAMKDFSVQIPHVKQESYGFLGFRERDVTTFTTDSNIFLIAEAGIWDIKKEMHVKPDPIVVGYKAGCLWVIDSFNETPLEEYVRREFARRK